MGNVTGAAVLVVLAIALLGYIAAMVTHVAFKLDAVVKGLGRLEQGRGSGDGQ